MATIAKKAASEADKPDLVHEIIQKLETALESFKEVWGEKKFRHRIKKASKLFLKGKPKKVAVKKEDAPPKKKATKKAIKKAAPAKKANQAVIETTPAKKVTPAVKEAAPAKKVPAKKTAPAKKANQVIKEAAPAKK